MPSKIASAKCPESWTTTQKKPQARLRNHPLSAPPTSAEATPQFPAAPILTGFFRFRQNGFLGRFRRAHAGPSRTQVDFGGSTQDVAPTAAAPARPAPACVR